MRNVMLLLGVALIVGLALSVGLLRAQDAETAKDAEAAKDPAPEKADMKKVSYSIGINIGMNFKQQGIELEADDFMAGIRDGLAGKEPRLSEADMRKVLMAYQKELAAREEERMAQHMEKMKQMGEENKTKGPAFLDENRKKEGVKVTESGLQYKVITEGTGKQPTATDTVTVHYKGTLIDGKEFDSSYTRGEPAVFQVGRVVRGWTEALQMMKEGSKWQIVLPAELAYGERGAGPDIAPNSVLIFEVELIKVGADE